MPDERTEHASRDEGEKEAQSQRTHLQRQRPAAPAHPAPGEGALVVVQGVGARRVAAVVVRAAAVPVAVAGGRVEAAEQEVGQRRRHRHGDLYSSQARAATSWGRKLARGSLVHRTQPWLPGEAWLPRRARRAFFACELGLALDARASALSPLPLPLPLLLFARRPRIGA
jgi:hypothetical protein